MKKFLSVALATSVLFAACSGNESKKADTNVEPSTTTTTTTETTETSKDVMVNGNDVFVNLTGDDNMKYNLNEIRVKAGQKIKLTLKNIGKLPVDAMGHNFVLLKPGTDMKAFANQAASEKANNYFPKDESGVIIHTKMLGPGESDSIEFDAPAAGTYEYLCTFPGHFMMMNGKLVVE